MKNKSFYPTLQNKFINSSVLSFVMFAILGYLLIPLRLFNFDYLCSNYRAGGCIDPAWMLGANLARSQNFVFGRDWVFTFGSFAFLSTRADVGVSKFWFIAFDVLVIANFCFIFRRFVKLNRIYGFIASFATAIIVASYRDTIFILTAFLIFWLCVAVLEKSDWAFFAASLITVLLFFIKVNASLVALVVFNICLVYAILFSRKKLVKMYLAIFTPLAIFAVSFLTNVAVFEYVRTSLSLIDCYNDAMQLTFYHQSLDLVAVLAVLIVASFLLFSYLKSLDLKNLSVARIINRQFVVLLVYSLVAFVLFKQSFVRSDGHVMAFFSMFPFIILIISAVYLPKNFRLFVMISLVLFCCEVGIIYTEGLSIAGLSRNIYIETVFANHDELQEKHYQSLKDAQIRKIPAAVLAEIGEDKTVDIIPYDVSLLYFNNLNYNPRPVIQSYSVFDDYLIKLNGQKYESATAPDFVVYSNDTLDDRYPFFDDQAAKIALIERYSCAKQFDVDGSHFALLKKTGFTPVKYHEPKTVESKFNQEFALPDVSKIYRVKIKTSYSILGKLVRILYRPNKMGIVITLENGESGTFRVSPQVLESGVLINPFIGNENDFCEFVAGNSADSKKRVKNFKIVNRDSTNAFDENITIEFAEVSTSKK